MKYLFFITPFLISSLAHALDLSERDKQLHATVSYALTVTMERALRPWCYGDKTMSMVTAGTATLMLGGLKEVMIDSKGDPQDMVANVVGTGVGLGFAYAF